MLKAPPDLHREDLKVPLGGPSAEERMVCVAERDFHSASADEPNV